MKRGLAEEQMIEHDQDFASQDDQGLPFGPPLLPIIIVGPAKAPGVALEGHSHEVEDMPQQGRSLFREATATGVFTGLIQSYIEPCKSHQGFGRGKSLDISHQGQEKGGQVVSNTRDGLEELPGSGEAFLDGLKKGAEDAASFFFQHIPEVEQEAEGLCPVGVMTTQRGLGQVVQIFQGETAGLGRREGFLEVLEGGLGHGRCGREGHEEGAQGFGETGIASFQFGEEIMEYLTDLVLDAGKLLGKVVIEAGQAGDRGRDFGVEWSGEAVGSPLLEEEEGQVMSVQAVGFGAAAGSGFGEVADLSRGEAVEGEVDPGFWTG